MKPLVAEVTLDWLLRRIYLEDSAGAGGQARDGTGCCNGNCTGADHLLQA